MDNLHRDLINHNLDKLMHVTNYETLRNECLQRKMLSGDMVARIEDTAMDQATRHRKLLEKITKRGPKAFNTLLDICQQKFPEAYSLLHPASSDQLMNNNARQEQ